MSNRTRLARYFGDPTSLLIDLQRGRNQEIARSATDPFPPRKALHHSLGIPDLPRRPAGAGGDRRCCVEDASVRERDSGQQFMGCTICWKHGVSIASSRSLMRNGSGSRSLTRTIGCRTTQVIWLRGAPKDVNRSLEAAEREGDSGDRIALEIEPQIFRHELASRSDEGRLREALPINYEEGSESRRTMSTTSVHQSMPRGSRTECDDVRLNDTTKQL